MEKRHLQHRETLLIETLLSGLDARESAKTAHSPMIVYLAEILIRRVREELDEVRVALDATVDETAPNGNSAT